MTRAEPEPGDYPSGTDAPLRARDRALARVAGAETVVLVEGVSDQVAVETAATLTGRDLTAERVVVVPIGGAHALRNLPAALRSRLGDVRWAGLYDAGEEHVVLRGLAVAGVASPRTRHDLEALGFFACDRDLEDELVRAVGPEHLPTLFARHGDLAAWEAFQRQPAWRGRDAAAQARRFLGSGARRKSRYARVLVEAALALDRLPRPVGELLRVVGGSRPTGSDEPGLSPAAPALARTPAPVPPSPPAPPRW